MKTVKEYRLTLDRQDTLDNGKTFKVFDVNLENTKGNKYCYQLCLSSNDNKHIDSVSGDVIQAGYIPTVEAMETATGWKFRVSDDNQ